MSIQLGFPTFLWEQVAFANDPWWQHVNVVEESKRGHFLVVDGISLVNHLHRESGLDCLFGGQHAAFEAVVIHWAVSLMEAGVELHIVFGGIGAQAKRDNVVYRGIHDIEMWEKVIAGDLEVNLPKPSHTNSLAKHALRGLESMEKLKGRPMLHLHFAFEELDAIVVELCSKHNAIGVLSNDTGFLFHRGCTLLPFNFFSAECSVAMDAPAVAAHLQLPSEVYTLVPAMVGCRLLPQDHEALKALHFQLVRQCYENGPPKDLSFSRAKLLSVLHFLRHKKKAEAVFQALRRLTPASEGTELADRIRCVVRHFTSQPASSPEEEPQQEMDQPTAEAADSWEDLCDGYESEPVPTVPSHPFQFQFVDLPQDLLCRLASDLKNHGTGASFLYLLERRDEITLPFLEVLAKPSPAPKTTTAELLCCWDAKLSMLRRVLYGMVFAALPEATVREVVRVPDGAVEVPEVVPLRAPGLPSARELLHREPEARWQWLKALLGLQAIPLALSSTAAHLMAFFMMCAHYPVPADIAEAWLCAQLCPREEGSMQPDNHPLLGQLPCLPGAAASLLQGYTPQQASAPNLHARYLFVVSLFLTALDLHVPSNRYFDSVVYRHVLHDSSKASALPWHEEVLKWLPFRLLAVDYHSELCALLPARKYQVALADLLTQQEEGWARVQETIMGTVTRVQREGAKSYALVMYRRRSNAAVQYKRLWDSDVPSFNKLVSGTSVTFRLRHGRVVDVKVHLT